MWIKIAPCILALALLLTPVSAVESGGEDTQDPGAVDAVVEVLDDGGIDEGTTAEPEVPEVPAGPTELDYLVSINTYMTYLFGIGAVFVFYFGCRLMYRFLNIFF